MRFGRQERSASHTRSASGWGTRCGCSSHRLLTCWLTYGLLPASLIGLSTCAALFILQVTPKEAVRNRQLSQFVLAPLISQPSFLTQVQIQVQRQQPYVFAKTVFATPMTACMGIIMIITPVINPDSHPQWFCFCTRTKRTTTRCAIAQLQPLYSIKEY